MGEGREEVGALRLTWMAKLLVPAGRVGGRLEGQRRLWRWPGAHRPRVGRGCIRSPSLPGDAVIA